MRKTLVLAFLFLSLQSRSQSKVSAVTPATFNIGGGSSKINSSFIVDWSIGESTIIETYYGENAYSNLIVGKEWNVTSGILQPYDKNHIIFNPLVPQWTLQEIRLYPVPTSDVIYIDFRSTITGSISMQLMTLSGKLLAEKQLIQINGHSTQSWNLKNQPSGSYYIKILLSSNEGKILKQGTFKFEKIN